MERNNESFQYRMVEEVIKRYESEAYWDGKVFIDFLEANVERFPRQEALVDERVRYTFLDLDRIVNNLASNLLDRGIGRNDVVAVQSPNRVEYVFMRYALSKIGAVIMSIGIGMRKREIAHLLGITRAKAFVVPSFFHGFDHAGMIDEIRKDLPFLKYVFLIEKSGRNLPPETELFEEMIRDRPVHEKMKGRKCSGLRKGPKEIDMLNLTSGTTGMPKICQCIPNARMLFGKQIAQRCGIGSSDKMVVICPITGGVGNSCSTLAAGFAGCTVLLQERFNETETLELIEKERPTVIVGVPTQFIKMLSVPDFQKYRLDSLRLVVSAGSYMPYEKAKEVIHRMNVKLISIFGSHDGGTITVGTPDLEEEVMCRTVGRPLPDIEFKIVDPQGREVPQGEVGEIVYRSGNACIGYFGDTEGTKSAFEPNGYFHSGDLVRLTPEGCLEVKGRSKDIIIRGGLNINPGEIEDILIKHPDLENVAVVGMPDPVLGERSCAYVVVKTGGGFTFEKMLSYLKEMGVATFKLPERLEVVEDIPLSEGKKPAKNILKKDIEGKLRREGLLP